jgi:hypothetical protein
MRSMKGKMVKLLACYLAVAIFAIGFSKQVYAGFAPSELTQPMAADRAENLQKIQSVLESKMVGERLKQLGFTTEEIKGKLAYLDDDQLHRLAVQIDELKVGGFHGWVVVLIIVAIVAIVLVAVYALR